MTDPDASARAVVGRLASRVYPGLDEALWRRQRRKIVRSLHEATPYARELTSTVPVKAPIGVDRMVTRPSHLLVVPAQGPSHPSWGPGTRNLYYEAYQGARERYGAERVSVMDILPDESPQEWQPRLLHHVLDSGATHLLTHIESDPGHIDGTWHWDALWSALSERWDGVLLGVMFDSAFQWIQAKSRLLGRMSANFVAVDICMPMDGVMVRGRPEVGPVNMPMSLESLALLDARLEGVEAEHDVSFIGTLYPHRVDMLDALARAGANVVVNPHRLDETRNFAESRANQPGWLDYMAGLASSRMTINFSRSSAGPFEQLKTRVLEATLAGTLLLTDDRDRTGRFFVPEEEYGYFASPDDLPSVVTRWLSQPERLDGARLAAQRKARVLAGASFFGGIEEGLRRRGLPQLGEG